MATYKIISIAAYVIGLLFWFIIWRVVIGFHWLKKEPLMHIPLWGGCVVFTMNIVLTCIAKIPPYATEISIYEYVEKNGITVAGFAMGIAIFVVLKFKDSLNIMQHQESAKFLQLIFTSFLIVILGVLPLYWIPQIDGWLTVLRNLKTVPYLYSLFILASAIVVYLHILKKDLNERIASTKQDNMEK